MPTLGQRARELLDSSPSPTRSAGLSTTTPDRTRAAVPSQHWNVATPAKSQVSQTPSKGLGTPITPARGDIGLTQSTSELVALRQKLAKLEHEARDAAQTKAELALLRGKMAALESGKAGEAGEAMQTPEPPKLQPNGRRFSIRGWNAERQAHSGAVGSTAVPIVSFDDMATSQGSHSNAPNSNVEEDEDSRASSGPWLARSSTPSSLVEMIKPAYLEEEVSVATECSDEPLGSQHSLLECKPTEARVAGLSVYSAALYSQFCAGGADTIMRSVEELFSSHLDNAAQPHLAVSVLVPPLFSLLRSSGGSIAGASDSSLLEAATFDKREKSACPFGQCSELVRRLMRMARFGDEPPSRRPEGMSRSQFVRELCVQLGLSLDLARLGFAMRRERDRKCRDARKSRSKESGNPPHSKEAAVAKLKLQSSPGTAAKGSDAMAGNSTCLVARSRSPSRGELNSRGRRRKDDWECCVGRTELDSSLARAGRYLAAVQMDMDRLRDDAEDQAAAAKERSHKVAMNIAALDDPSSTAIVPENPHDDLFPPELVIASDCLPLPLMDMPEALVAKEPAIPGEAASISKVVSPAGSDVIVAVTKDQGEASIMMEGSLVEVMPSFSATSSRAALDSDSISAPVLLPPTTLALEPPGSFAVDRIDTSPFPTCGEFLADQLLPLYVIDIPFHRLRQVVEDYAGMPLDSDDEDRALKALGRSSRRREPQRGAGGASAIASTAATPNNEGKTAAVSTAVDMDKAPLSKLRVVAEKSSSQAAPTSLRQGMSTSIVEKRAKNFARTGPSDMAVKSGRGRRQAPSLGDLAKLASKPSRPPINAPPPVSTPLQRNRSKIAASSSLVAPSAALLLSPAGPPSARGRFIPSTPVSMRKVPKRTLMDELPDVGLFPGVQWGLLMNDTPEVRPTKAQKLED